MIFAQLSSRQFFLKVRDSFSGGEPKFKLIHHYCRKIREESNVGFRGRPGHKVEYAKCSQVEPVMGPQRNA
jgi:hypothetical protein